LIIFVCKILSGFFSKMNNFEVTIKQLAKE